MRLTYFFSAFCKHICSVIFVRPQKQVVRVNASGHITPMAEDFPLWDFAFPRFPYCSVCDQRLSFVARLAIAAIYGATHPDHAAAFGNCNGLFLKEVIIERVYKMRHQMLTPAVLLAT